MNVSSTEHDGRPQPCPLSEFTGFERDLLRAVARLSGTDPYGQIIKQELESEYEESINHSRFYQNLDGLVQAGLVRKLPLDGRTNVYRLTDRADARLHAHYAWEEECLLALDEDAE